MWSVGAVLHCVLSGCLPFDRDDFKEQWGSYSPPAHLSSQCRDLLSRCVSFFPVGWRVSCVSGRARVFLLRGWCGAFAPFSKCLSCVYACLVLRACSHFCASYYLGAPLPLPSHEKPTPMRSTRLPFSSPAHTPLFLHRLLCVDPSSRLTATEALEHPWLEGPHAPVNGTSNGLTSPLKTA